MTDVRPLPDDDFPAFVALAARAYPGMRVVTPEARTEMTDRLRTEHHDRPDVTAYGAYRDGELRGGMLIHDYTMRCFEADVPLGGVGMVAVELLHKKEKVARDMIQFYLQHYADRGYPLAALYPFRPDFYKQMGFGYGTTKHQYRVRPDALPRGTSKARLRYLTADDKAAMLACYTRYRAQTHGLLTRIPADYDRRFDLRLTIVGCKGADGTLDGYMICGFKKGSETNFLKNDLLVHELVYLDRAALAEMFTFLHTQADQIDRIVFNTEDAHFHYALSDPRSDGDRILPHVYHESAVVGVGLMYRVLSVPGLFAALADHDFGGQSLTLQITLTDSFLPDNAGSTVVRFEAGRATVTPDARTEVEIALDVSDFSALVLGCVPFERLHMYGLVAISDEAHVATLDRLFRTDVPPICMTAF
jgi:predicted acetyltransferase